MARRNISIPEDIDTFLNTLPNASGYIVSLIRADMKSDKAITREEVINLIINLKESGFL